MNATMQPRRPSLPPLSFIISAGFLRCSNVTLTRLLMISVLFLAPLPIQSAQSDPLRASYLPSIDTNAAHYPGYIWITNTMQKIRQDSGPPGTIHWGTFYGTQNEFVDFQVHVQANSGPISN